MEHLFSIDPWSWVYMSIASTWLWLTVNALWPTYWPGWAATWSWISGWLTSELAPGHAISQIVGSLLLILMGALSDWPGRYALALTGLSLLGTHALQRRARRCGPVCQDAIRDGLGAAPSGRAETPIDWTAIARPFPIRSVGAEVMRDIAYFSDGPDTLRLDIYRSPARPKNSPVLLQIHGGAWFMGRKDDQAVPLMTRLARSGWVCVAIQYRLAPAHTLPAPLIDAKRALAWIRENIAEYGGDPGFVAVTGGSAGGHLAALLALTANEPRYQPGFEAVDTRVDACVPFYGVYDLLDRESTMRNRAFRRLLESKVLASSPESDRATWEDLSPVSQVSDAAPPFFVLHGDRDTLVPVAMARQFVTALRDKSKQPVCYAELPGAQHAFDVFPSVRSLRAVDAVHAFLDDIHARRGMP